MESRTLVLPIAGESSRFKSEKPKWAMTDTNTRKTMVVSSILGIVHNFNRIVLIPLEKHMETDWMYQVEYELRRLEKPFDVYPITFSNSQPETIFKGIHNSQIAGKPVRGSFLVKDCDNFWVFSGDENGEQWKLGRNYVVFDYIDKYPDMLAQNKSFIEFDSMGVVNNIVEKRVISDCFNVGGYGFKSVEEFQRAYYQMEASPKVTELHVSHLIYAGMLHFQQEYFAVQADKFIDWGTQEDWERYNNGG